jgi:hypothetical protein
VPAQNWKRPLPRPIVIPKVMTLSTLDDVRTLVHRHLPSQFREKDTLPAEEVAVAVRMVLQLERAPCR